MNCAVLPYHTWINRSPLLRRLSKNTPTVSKRARSRFINRFSPFAVICLLKIADTVSASSTLRPLKHPPLSQNPPVPPVRPADWFPVSQGCQTSVAKCRWSTPSPVSSCGRGYRAPMHKALRRFRCVHSFREHRSRQPHPQFRYCRKAC